MTCPWCAGTGKVQHTDDKGTKMALCVQCGGSGEVPDQPEQE